MSGHLSLWAFRLVLRHSYAWTAAALNAACGLWNFWTWNRTGHWWNGAIGAFNWLAAVFVIVSHYKLRRDLVASAIRAARFRIELERLDRLRKLRGDE